MSVRQTHSHTHVVYSIHTYVRLLRGPKNLLFSFRESFFVFVFTLGHFRDEEKKLFFFVNYHFHLIDFDCLSFEAALREKNPQSIGKFAVLREGETTKVLALVCFSCCSRVIDWRFESWRLIVLSVSGCHSVGRSVVGVGRVCLDGVGFQKHQRKVDYLLIAFEALKEILTASNWGRLKIKVRYERLHLRH